MLQGRTHGCAHLARQDRGGGVASGEMVGQEGGGVGSAAEDLNLHAGLRRKESRDFRV